jgi:hypothetical protein
MAYSAHVSLSAISLGPESGAGMTNAIPNEADEQAIGACVRLFYKRARNDALLSRVFAVSVADWEHRPAGQPSRPIGSSHVHQTL